MPKKVKEVERSRSISLSLQAPQIYILEMMARRRMEVSGDTAIAYREAVDDAGAYSGIYAYIHTSDGLVMSPGFKDWLQKRGWDDEHEYSKTERARDKSKGKHLYSSVLPIRQRRRRKRKSRKVSESTGNQRNEPGENEQ